ncbi:hypothetical protein PM082_011147 [Marasmius tenuissimus]|nr:hypothetical protein PM082_011147 [Marasmius tenuissimus]
MAVHSWCLGVISMIRSLSVTDREDGPCPPLETMARNSMVPSPCLEDAFWMDGLTSYRNISVLRYEPVFRNEHATLLCCSPCESAFHEDPPRGVPSGPDIFSTLYLATTTMIFGSGCDQKALRALGQVYQLNNLDRLKPTSISYYHLTAIPMRTTARVSSSPLPPSVYGRLDLVPRYQCSNDPPACLGLSGKCMELLSAVEIVWLGGAQAFELSKAFELVVSERNASLFHLTSRLWIVRTCLQRKHHRQIAVAWTKNLQHAPGHWGRNYAHTY